MLVNDVPKEKVADMVEQIFSMYDPGDEYNLKTVKRALSLYRNGAVYNATVNDDTIKANVLENGQSYKVELELDFIEISYCDCNEMSDFCVHKMATLFYVFSLFASPGEQYNQWKSDSRNSSQARTYSLLPDDNQQEQMAATSSPESNDRQDNEPLQQNFQEPPYSDYSLESWYSFFNKKYGYFKQRQEQKASYYWSYNRDTMLVSAIFEEYYPTILAASKPSSPVGERLFQIYAAAFTFEKIVEKFRDIHVSMYVHQTIAKYLSELCEDIDNHIFIMQEQNLVPSKEDIRILSETPDRILELLFLSRDFQFDRFRLFQFLCPLLSYSKIWIEKLEQQLQNRLQQEEQLKKLGKINFSSECRLALAHLAFLVQDDAEAIRRLVDGNNNELYFYTTWIKTLAYHKRWDRFEIWLPFIKERMDEYIHQYGDQQSKRDLADFYLYFIKQFGDAKDLESVYIDALHGWLPFSYNDFSNYLLDKKDYRKWIELQLFIHIPIEYIDNEIVKKIEEADRSYLLPLYHNAVEEKINLKNRDAYRQAAKYLRKLRTYYRTLKQDHVWEKYINGLSLKYKRLRAFQEELRKGKGKLIND